MDRNLQLKLTNEFSHQKVAIFSFGGNANKDTGSVLKISQFREAEIEHMNQGKVPTHSISEERIVAFFNYEREI